MLKYLDSYSYERRNPPPLKELRQDTVARSLNKVQLIGNIVRDPEMKFTPKGSAVCTLTIATNRNWTTDTGEKKEEADFTRCVAWNKLAEICGQLLKKGRKVYVEGRLSTRSWQDKDGSTKYMTEVILADMILLDKKDGETGDVEVAAVETNTGAQTSSAQVEPEPNEEDIPF